MKRFFPPNIGRRGRLMRGLIASTLLIGGGFAYRSSRAMGIVLMACGAFVLFESLRGWCVARACGFKTRL